MYVDWKTTPVSHTDSGVTRISFRGGFKIFMEKWGHLQGAKRVQRVASSPRVC